MYDNNMEPDIFEDPHEHDNDWIKDSDRIFKTITEAAFKDHEEAKLCVVKMYIPDLTFSRAGVAHALKRIEAHYKRRKL